MESATAKMQAAWNTAVPHPQADEGGKERSLSQPRLKVLLKNMRATKGEGTN